MVQSDKRKRLDNGNDPGVIIPSPGLLSEFGDDYATFIANLKSKITSTRSSVALQANQSVILLYWSIGRDILEQQKHHGWGAKVIDRIAHDLQKEYPETHGFSARSLKYMRRFAELWPDEEFVQRTVAQIPWRTNIALMQKVHDSAQREWYARAVVSNGWSREKLVGQIETHAFERAGQASNNFERVLPQDQASTAVQVFKDPYLFDFLGTSELRHERDVEQSLTEHIQEFLIELGQGFAFVGRQVHLELGGDDYYIDMLFYHLKLRCYVVVELKAREFDPSYLGQLNMYQNVVNTVLRHPDDKPTIGLLLVKDKNEVTVRYSLEGHVNPIGVADWQRSIAKVLPDEIKSSLPSVEDIERELDDVDDDSA